MNFSSLHIYFDGACNNNSNLKQMGMGVHISENGRTCKPLCSALNGGTNGTSNIAEWLAFLEALDIALAYKLSHINTELSIRIYGDSKLIINQYSGVWQIKAPHLREYRKRAIVYRRMLGTCLKTVQWIPREKNKEADALSKEGLSKPFF